MAQEIYMIHQKWYESGTKVVGLGQRYPMWPLVAHKRVEFCTYSVFLKYLLLH